MEHEAKAKARQFINPEQMKVAERKKIKMLADDIIVYRENAQESEKKIYGINKFSKVMKYKKTYKNQLSFYILAMSI